MREREIDHTEDLPSEKIVSRRVEELKNYYENAEHAPRNGAGIGFNEMVGAPEDVIDFFGNNDDTEIAALGEKYMMHNLNDDELTRLAQLFEKHEKEKYGV